MCKKKVTKNFLVQIVCIYSEVKKWPIGNQTYLNLNMII